MALIVRKMILKNLVIVTVTHIRQYLYNGILLPLAVPMKCNIDIKANFQDKATHVT